MFSRFGNPFDNDRLFAPAPLARRPLPAWSGLALGLCLSVIGGLGTAPAGAELSHPGEFPDVVATVNGHPVTKAELLTQGALIRSQMRKAEGVAPQASLKFYRDVLDGLIGEVLIFDDGVKRGLGATDEEVEHAVQGLRGAYDGDEAFQAALLEQGTSLPRVREQLRRSLSLEKVLRQEVGSEASVGEAEARQFYEQNKELMQTPAAVRVRHIVVRPDKNDPEAVREARALLLDLRRKIASGADFADLAKIHSQDGKTRDQGGDLPWVPITGSEADQRLQALGIGELSDIEETHHGLHLIQMQEKRPASVVPFEQAKERILFMLTNSKMRLGVQERVEKLRASAKIEIFI